MRFRLSTLVLLLGLVGVAIGWAAERRYYKKELEKSEIAITRWDGQDKVVQLASSWKCAWNNETKKPELFDNYIDSELVWVLSEAFKLERDLDRIDTEPSPIEMSMKVASLLGCSNPKDLRSRIVETDAIKGQDPSLFPEFLDEQSKDYVLFGEFLNRVFQGTGL